MSYDSGMAGSRADVYQSATPIPELPGPPVAVTKTPRLSPEAGKTAKGTGMLRPSAGPKWSSGISRVTPVNSDSGHRKPPRSSRIWSVEWRSVGVDAGDVVVAEAGGEVV